MKCWFCESDTSTGYTSYYTVLGSLKCADCRLEWRSHVPQAIGHG